MRPSCSSMTCLRLNKTKNNIRRCQAENKLSMTERVSLIPSYWSKCQ